MRKRKVTAVTEYFVSYMVIYGDTVNADSPEEAADIVAAECPYDVDGYAHVTNKETGESWDV